MKTVIHCEEDAGILSYLCNGNISGIEIIDITYFEKPGFFAYWDQQSNSYQFLNYLDEDVCEKMTATNNNLSSLDDRKNYSFH